ncbi:MAG: hypothetical protein EA400_05665 [Chromatiaceae bacterium]|nr:MAG: hypothetical protein EA400_05665 [Chromatiaceae bacterium]
MNDIATASAHAAEQLVRAVLRSGGIDWPGDDAPADQPRGPGPTARDLLAAAAHHGVTLLLYARLKPTASWQTWPEALRRALEQQAQTATTRDLLRTRELVATLATLTAAGITPLVMKGAALAHSLYPAPALRTRQDTDLLVRRDQAAPTARLLEARGYRSAQRLDALAHFNHQIEYHQRDGYDIRHTIDLHWRISNTELFALAWTQTELAQRAVPVPALGPAVRALGFADALLLACAHRAHHAYEPAGEGEDRYAGDRLIWLYDIHLLAQAMTTTDWECFTRLASAKRLQRICLDSFTLTRQALGTNFPGPVMAALTRTAHRAIPLEALQGNELQRLLATLRATRSWARRLGLIASYLFPPPAYILAKYDTQRRWQLPLLYVRRIAEGLRKPPG